MLERKLCPACKKRLVAINYKKYGRTYYRDRCGMCYRNHRKPMPAGWIRSGYKKREKCEKCGFKFKTPDQAQVFHVNGNIDDNDWLNLKTICANCSIEIATSSEKWRPSKLCPDL